MWDVATSCPNLKCISAVKLQGFKALRLGPWRFCTPCPYKRQDSQLHSVVIAVTVAYLISDALWILLQPDMVMPLIGFLASPLNDSRAGYSDKRVKREANRIPACFHVQQNFMLRIPSGCFCFLNAGFWGQNTKEHHCSPHRLALTCIACDSRPEMPFPAVPGCDLGENLKLRWQLSWSWIRLNLSLSCQ